MRIIIFIVLIFFLTCSTSLAVKDIQEGISLYKLGNYYKAEKVFRENIAQDPNNFTAQYMLAVTLVNLKQYNEAKMVYKNIIKYSPSQKLVSLSKTGLLNIGERYEADARNDVSRAILNVNIAGGVIIINDVILNNNYKAKFIFDTGATYTTISKDVATRLKIDTQNAKKIKIMTGSGYINTPLITIPKVEVKGLVVRNVEAIVADLPVHKSGDSHGLAGLLGLSFLEKFKVTVDRAKNQVTLEKNI